MRHRLKVNQIKPPRKPFWLPASSYYFLVAGFAAASFFLVIGIVHDNGRKPEIVLAGLIASGVLVSGVVVREVVLRNAREKYIAERNRLDSSLKHAFLGTEDPNSGKFTISKNAAAIENIRVRSEAAKVFGRIPDSHREVFILCEEYRKIVAQEIHSIHPHSPRLKPLLQGNDFAQMTHKYHLLRWAELESKALVNEAGGQNSLSVRSEYASRARAVLQQALESYPVEPTLRESLDLLDEMIFTIKGTEFIESAESAVKTGDREKARNIYLQGLSYLKGSEMDSMSSKLRLRIEAALDELEAKIAN